MPATDTDIGESIRELLLVLILSLSLLLLFKLTTEQCFSNSYLHLNRLFTPFTKKRCSSGDFK